MEREKKAIFFQKTLVVAILGILCNFLFGSIPPIVKYCYETINMSGDNLGGQISFAGIQFIASGILGYMVVCIKYKKIMIPQRRMFLHVVQFAFIQTFLQHVFYYIGVANTTSVKSSVLYSVGTFFTIILAHFLYKDDKMSLKKGLGCALGFAGIVAINFGGSMGMGINIMGDGFIVIAAFLFAVGSLIAKMVTQGGDPLFITSMQLVIGGILLFVSGRFVFPGELVIEQTHIWGVILVLGTMSIGANAIWNTLLKYNRAGRVAIYYFLMPVFGVIMSALVLGENIFSLKNIVALVCVSFGIYIINANK